MDIDFLDFILTKRKEEKWLRKKGRFDYRDFIA